MAITGKQREPRAPKGSRTIAKYVNQQYLSSCAFEFIGADIAQYNGEFVKVAVTLPTDTRVFSGFIRVDEAFASGTTLQVGDIETANRYSSTAIDLSAVGITQLTPISGITTIKNLCEILFTFNQVSETGQATLCLTYAGNNKGDFTLDNNWEIINE